MTKLDMILKMAGLDVEDFALAEHRKGYLNLSVRLDEGKVVDASSMWYQHPNSDGVVSIANYGNGASVCLCDHCTNHTNIPTSELKNRAKEIYAGLEKSLKKYKISDSLKEKSLQPSMSERVVEFILKDANLTLADIALAQHNKGMLSIYIFKKDGIIIGADYIHQTNSEYIEYNRQWLPLISYGTGVNKCNCYDCSRGKNPREIDHDLDTIKLELENTVEKYRIFEKNLLSKGFKEEL